MRTNLMKRTTAYFDQKKSAQQNNSNSNPIKCFISFDRYESVSEKSVEAFAKQLSKDLTEANPNIVVKSTLGGWGDSEFELLNSNLPALDDCAYVFFIGTKQQKQKEDNNAICS